MSITKQRETEQFLGPLSEDWEKGVTLMGRYYFVDHASKNTTWIDPRTEGKRQHDITKIAEGELPYGWEEAHDEACGLYYIDHTTKSTFLDPPWDKVIQEHYKDLKEHVEKESKRLESKDLESKRKEKIEKATEKVQVLEGARERLEREVKEMKEKARKREAEAEAGPHAVVEPAVVDMPAGVQEQEEAVQALQEQLQDVAAQLPGADHMATTSEPAIDAPLIDAPIVDAPLVAEAPLVAKAPVAEAPLAEAPLVEAPLVDAPLVDAPADVGPAPVLLAATAVKAVASDNSDGPIKMAPLGQIDAQMTSEMVDFQARLQELKLLIDAMSDETRTYANMTTAADKEVQEIGYLLEEEANQRTELSAFIEGIKSDMVEMVKSVSESNVNLAAESISSDMDVDDEDDAPPAMSSAAQPRYLVDMEVELVALKQRLEEAEVASSQESLGGSIEGMDAAEVVRQRMIKESEDMAMPDWLKKVNMDLGKSKTLRTKVNKMQQQNPDAMSFREKMLFYTAGAVEKGDKGKGKRQ